MGQQLRGCNPCAIEDAHCEVESLSRTSLLKKQLIRILSVCKVPGLFLKTQAHKLAHKAKFARWGNGLCFFPSPRICTKMLPQRLPGCLEPPSARQSTHLVHATWSRTDVASSLISHFRKGAVGTAEHVVDWPGCYFGD